MDNGDYWIGYYVGMLLILVGLPIAVIAGLFWIFLDDDDPPKPPNT